MQRANITHFVRNMDLPSDDSDANFNLDKFSSDEAASDSKSGVMRSRGRARCACCHCNRLLLQLRMQRHRDTNCWRASCVGCTLMMAPTGDYTKMIVAKMDREADAVTGASAGGVSGRRARRVGTTGTSGTPGGRKRAGHDLQPRFYKLGSRRKDKLVSMMLGRPVPDSSSDDVTDEECLNALPR